MRLVVRGVVCLDLLERAREQGYTKDEIAKETNRYANLKALVDDAEE